MANGKPAPITPKLPLVMKVRGLNSLNSKRTSAFTLLTLSTPENELQNNKIIQNHRYFVVSVV
jgi:hypothetical protein